MKHGAWARWLPVGSALAGLVAAAAFSIRAGVADYRIHQDTVPGTLAAIAAMPSQAEYHARLAWLVSGDDPRQAQDALRRAVALNPWDARSWIELGLRAEAEGDARTSTQCLHRAAEVDATFLPRWTLANYYFRHDDVDMFWFWARQAAAMVYGDPLPVFRLCAKVEENGTLIDRLEIRNPRVRTAYLSYLLDQKRVDLIGSAVTRLLENIRQEDVPVLLTACERLLQAGRVDEAVHTWNRLAGAGRVPFRTPGGEGDQFLANGGFTVPPSSQGFDWRLPPVEGMEVSREEEPLGLRFTFSGRQPEDSEILAQLVPLRGRTPYELRFVYRTRGIAAGSGLAWRITDALDGALLREGPSLVSEADALMPLSFETPATCRLVRLSLRYRRTPGTTRVAGFLVLRNVAVEPLNP